MVLFYGLVLEILQYTRFNWKFTVLCENFTVYKIQLKIYSIIWTFYSIQDSILQYIFYSMQDSIENSTVYKN